MPDHVRKKSKKYFACAPFSFAPGHAPFAAKELESSARAAMARMLFWPGDFPKQVGSFIRSNCKSQA
jgi:hypothetical protein